MVQQGAGENLCQFFLSSCSVPCRLRGAESSQPLPGSRKAQTRQQFREKLQGNACDVRQNHSRATKIQNGENGAFSC